MTIKTANLGFPRIGRHRELKFALERYWAGKASRDELLDTGAKLRAENWAAQKARGVDIIPSNDFSFYDHVLDTAVLVGAIPAAYGWKGGAVDLDTYFAIARGSTGAPCASGCTHTASDSGNPALEMTKWFDTNYHYMVPEFDRDQRFELTHNRPLDAFLEALALGYRTRPVLLGPVTFLKLGKAKDGDFDPVDLIERLLPVYARLLAELDDAGVEWIQIDEPCLVLDLTDKDRRALDLAYRTFAAEIPRLKIMLATYFGSIGDNTAAALALPVAGLHVDLVRAPQQIDTLIQSAPADRVLSLGVVDGRNIWRTDLAGVLRRLQPLVSAHGRDRIELAPSCSLLHVPIDLDLERALDPELSSWLAFAVQKLDELRLLARAFEPGLANPEQVFSASTEAAKARLTSLRIHDPLVAGRLKALTAADGRRLSPFATRRALQAERLSLPLFPTTTIGSFPQTSEVRQARSLHAKGELSYVDYVAYLRKETEQAVRWQEEIGIDVLVHGELRNDMVQYFAEQLSGYAFTQSGWVQSYGSRYVRPPVIFGDVSRPNPMTIEWAAFAQSLTDRPVKGMLTGPVTMLQWSFVRDDLPRAVVCRQIALALRDEVIDLEAAGIAVIQIDEPALREGLPLKAADRKAYLDWAVECFRLSAAGVNDATQIHTHMCYSEFNDIMAAIAAMDADVISIESSRSKMELLGAFTDEAYPNEIGPGVYDIHSPRMPDVTEMVHLIEKATEGLQPAQIWINPDCGLKTRGWEETKPALVNMVAASRTLRRAFAARKRQAASA
ncbi:5-methyltetrahydropteroyltriglutamate--homocysteine S-methyltransferase [Ensifer sp. LC13]|uniref:5-methyltetrahydropteroyltriglutamate-- homocysteine S-methyltransferase n=1 Tax=unclassified Ensifer TaxID=2633371 RepID=UPI000812CF97|nr:MULTISPECIES: 5-methyltetrahydropteroyltriglutamate--homocysteine S-methyltransferase [unclassified Ensifer]OCP00028.1 5-methyltetrahydropteroyltriglutamate--homocysteine S-methyltransferase [Ensifer sp. LC11]OCP00352.1 5-methyltetrahydropteroyltriglutamate--homocysteine S-methyltransferase [Ensifer sp. LC13]OCP30916.1 5-methyltetrahydropteroyltriglutamate--homocysteine S-methyltransferase [Ensifer sp. LC499]